MLKAFYICTALSLTFVSCGPPNSSAGMTSDTEQSTSVPEYTVSASTTSFKGLVIEKSFWGPPGYGEDTLKDSKETCYQLQLDFPVTVFVDNGQQQSMLQIKDLQILAKESAVAFLNKRVKLSGKLFLAESGHHHSDVLISTSWIEAAK